MEKFSYYEFDILTCLVPGFAENENKWVMNYIYVIYDPDYKPCEQTIIRESNEYFESEQEARLAAIGHISLLENGEG